MIKPLVYGLFVVSSVWVLESTAAEPPIATEDRNALQQSHWLEEMALIEAQITRLERQIELKRAQQSPLIAELEMQRQLLSERGELERLRETQAVAEIEARARLLEVNINWLEQQLRNEQVRASRLINEVEAQARLLDRQLALFELQERQAERLAAGLPTVMAISGFQGDYRVQLRFANGRVGRYGLGDEVAPGMFLSRIHPQEARLTIRREGQVREALLEFSAPKRPTIGRAEAAEATPSALQRDALRQPPPPVPTSSGLPTP